MNGDKFIRLFLEQSVFQERVEGETPKDDPVKFQYHITALQEEIGEVLKADKRWKTHRNVTYDPVEKLDEISDCFIYLMNIAMWSGYSAGSVLDGINKKIKENNVRLDKEE